MKYHIARIEEKDIQGFRDALDKVARERKYLLWDKAPELSVSAAFVKANIARNYPQYVAFCDDKIVGWVDIIPNAQAFAKHRGTLGIGIIDGYRKRGIGTALIEAASQHAKSIGIEKVELGVREDNKNAELLYKKLGFVTYGIRINAIKIGETYYNEILMEKYL